MKLGVLETRLNSPEEQVASLRKEVREKDTQLQTWNFNPDEWSEFNTEYPSGYIYPMHFVHPVTGKPSTEARRNAALKLGPNKYRPPNR